MPKIELNVSSDTFDEISNALNDKGTKINGDDPILLTKDIAIKGPINYRRVNLRHQILMEVAKVYKTPIDKDDYEVSNSKHFIDFLDDVFHYILEGKERIAEVKTKAINPNKPKPAVGW